MLSPVLLYWSCSPQVSVWYSVGHPMIAMWSWSHLMWFSVGGGYQFIWWGRIVLHCLLHLRMGSCWCMWRLGWFRYSVRCIEKYILQNLRTGLPHRPWGSRLYIYIPRCLFQLFLQGLLKMCLSHRYLVQLFSAPSKWNAFYRITEIGAHKLRLHAPVTMDIIEGSFLFDAFPDVFMSCILFRWYL